jgi:hypothetical protein
VLVRRQAAAPRVRLSSVRDCWARRVQRGRAGREPEVLLFNCAERALRRVDFNSPQGDGHVLRPTSVTASSWYTRGQSA